MDSMVAARVIPAFRAVDTPHASLRAATRPRHSCASASTTSCSASSSDRRGRSAELPAWRASRRELASLSLLSVAGLASLSLPHPARAETLYELFDLAQQLGQRGEFEEADKAWTRAIELDPKNSASWSNRGTARLQACRWKDALADLEKAVALDGPKADALTLNNRGNARGAVGDWEGAKADYTEASKNRSILPIARANYALALFETGDDLSAIEATRGLLRKDPEFWDMRAATTAFLWASGQEDRAESQWLMLCRSGRGFGAPQSPDAAGQEYSPEYSAEMLKQQFALVGATLMGTISEGGGDTTPCNLYKDINLVAGRWPPRCTAALDAFLHLSRTGQAKDYDGKMNSYQFASKTAAAQ